MKYAGDYYKNLRDFNKSQSNMNRMAWHIERWHKTIRFKRKIKDFDYTIMIDDTIPFNQDKFNQLEEIYLKYLKQMSDIGKQNALSRNYKDYKNYIDDNLTKEEVLNTKINWDYYYDQYRKEARLICPNSKELANLVVRLCYEKYPNKNKKFIWKVAARGILRNLNQVDITLPIKDPNGKYEYLGNKYNLQEANFNC